MQSSKVLKVLEWAKSFVYWIGRKIKALLWHIAKHPLGSIFWVVKAYLALMFLTLFVACSFGAFAVDLGTIETHPAKKTLGVTCNAFINNETFGPFSGENFGKCAEAGAAAINARIVLPPASSSVQNSATTTTTTNRSFEVINKTYETSADVGYKITEVSVTNSCYANASTGWQPQCDASPEQTHVMYISGVVNQLSQTEVYICPPEGFPEFTDGPSASNLCSKPVPIPQKCWPAGGDWSLIPMYHFGTSGANSICTLNDEGENCPWKLSGTGVYVPDPYSSLNCDNQPPEPPPPAPDCKTSPSGLKVCAADPNERCSTISEPNKVPVTSCDAKCGYVNGVFACYDNPNEPSDNPTLPDKLPLKNVDDTITDPNKSFSDMVKNDFKDIFGGAEDRLDNILTSAENTQKSNEALLSSLLASGRDSNRKLSSIDENTKGTRENTKAILDAISVTGDVSGGEKPDFNEPKNNWQTRNFGTILKAKGDELMALPLFQSVDNFFNVSFGGTCPQYTVSVWVFDISVDQFCNPTVNALWPYIRAVVLLVCSFFAIRIALL